jgi:hypothetical protein
MTLRVVYINPNPSGSNVAYIDDVVQHLTKNRELHIWKRGDPKEQPSLIFAVGQWVLAEIDHQANKVEGEPLSLDRHNAGDGPAPFGDRPVRERAAGRRKSGLNDLAYPTPEAIRDTQAASVQFAIDNMKVPWSEAHMRSLLEYEKQVALEFGQDAVGKLPWNRIPRARDED